MITTKLTQKQKGFSLLELVVVLTIFLIVTSVSVDLFISVVKNQRRVLQEQELLNQSSYVMEHISTALKMAQKDPSGECLGTAGNIYVLTHCPNGTLEACNGIKFINQLDNNSCDEFYLDSSDPQNPTLRETKGGLLSNKFNIKYGRFILNGNKSVHVVSATDPGQPRVTMLLDVKTNSTDDSQEKIIQTTISKRYLNSYSSSLSSNCLAGYWKLDENPTQAGATIQDSSGNNLWGTPRGPFGTNNLPQSNSDVPFGFPTGSRSLGFDGDDDYVDLGNSPILNPSSAISVAFWIKKPPLQYFSIGNDSWHIYQGGLAFNSLQWVTYNGAGDVNDLATSITVGDELWHQITVVWKSGQDQKKMYVDGVQVAVGSHSTTLSPNNSNVSIKFFDVHQGSVLDASLLDDVRIYNCALTDSQVQDLQTPGGPVRGIDTP